MQQIQVTGIGPDGRPFDVTHTATFQSIDSGTAAVEGTALRAVSDGNTRLKVSYGGREAEVEVGVVDRDTIPPVHFKIDIMPILSKLGCKIGRAHV